MNNYTDIDLCSKALLKIGASTIDSFEDGVAEAEVSTNLYPMIRDGLISAHPWNFAVTQSKLSRLTIIPVADYQYAYQLPLNLLRIISAGVGARGKGLEYSIQENMLLSNFSNVTLTYIYRPAEYQFPAYFVDILVSKLAAEFCLPLTESTSRAEYLTKKFEGEFSKAKLLDSQQDTPQTFEDFTLVEVRR